MPRFEVHIPAVDTTGFNFTFRVDADNWMAALKTGMRKLGEQGAHGQNVLVDIQDDNSLHVTEPESGRVFQIRELSEQEAAAAQVKRPAKRPAPGEVPLEDRTTEPLRKAPALPEARTLQEMPVVTPIPARMPQADAMKLRGVGPTPGRSGERPTTGAQRPPGTRSGEHSRPTARSSREHPAAAPPPGEATQAIRRPSSSRVAKPDSASVVELERPVRPVGAIGRRPERRTTREDIESVLTEVFERVQSVNARRSEEDALYFLLDLALEKIPAEAGTIFLADAATGDLRFAAVRGPRAQELLRANLVVPAGAGIVGFCATEGVSVALSDVQKDPRYWAAVAAKVNYETRSVVCSPMMTDGRTYGCVQLLNKKGTPLFSELEIGLVTYIAHQAALYLASRP